jgi:hypothetical protein
VVACFDGGDITSNAGALVLGQVDRGLGLMRRFAACFTDRRDPRFVEHQVETLVGQRIFGLALGYEDLVDHDELRNDPTLAVLAGKLEPVLYGFLVAHHFSFTQVKSDNGASMRFNWDGCGVRQRGFAGTRNARKRRRLCLAAEVFSVVWCGAC